MVTSGSPSPTLSKNIALAYVPPAMSAIGTPVYVEIRSQKVKAQVVSTPFYKRARKASPQNSGFIYAKYGLRRQFDAPASRDRKGANAWAYPANYRYTSQHEWVDAKGDVATIGITDYAQHELGDVVFVELPKPGTKVTAGKSFGTVESVKAVSDIYAPVSGEVVEANGELPQHAGKNQYRSARCCLAHQGAPRQFPRRLNR